MFFQEVGRDRCGTPLPVGGLKDFLKHIWQNVEPIQQPCSPRTTVDANLSQSELEGTAGVPTLLLLLPYAALYTVLDDWKAAPARLCTENPKKTLPYK